MSVPTSTSTIHDIKRRQLFGTVSPAMIFSRDTLFRSCCQPRNSIATCGTYIGFLFFLACYSSVTLGFTLSTSTLHSVHPDTGPGTSPSLVHPFTHFIQNANPPSYSTSSRTRLNVWWFGGSNSEYSSSNGMHGDDSCELVAVRIDRTSPNSRRISADISIPRPMEDVWAILTDYDQLATHVPNLVESRRIVGVADTYDWSPREGNPSQPGDGTYKCRLYQKGAQKIIGFEFRASLVMDMTESIVVSGNRSRPSSSGELPIFPEDRRIGFKCVESQFFSEFDGEWRLQSSLNSATGEPETLVTYVVDVRPKGPVPVVALEWRIREDVPTNLRAVKKTSMEVGYQGVVAMRQKRLPRSSAEQWSLRDNVSNTSTSLLSTNNASSGRLASAGTDVAQNVKQIVSSAASKAVSAATAAATNRTQLKNRLSPVRVQWYDDETMAKYLKKDKS